MNIILSEIEVRVLGSLVEKEITTPDYYPLSLNALVNACNQKSNRDPLMSLDENAVRQALRVLDEWNLAGASSGADSRVTKYEHHLQEVFNFNRHEVAVMCELLLRGPQTPGELRSRAERMHHFDDLGIVQSTLQRLINREPSLVKPLPKLSGTKEIRYAHLLSGDVKISSAAEAPSINPPAGNDQDRLAGLDQKISELQLEISELKKQFADFRKQFD